MGEVRVKAKLINAVDEEMVKEALAILESSDSGEGG